MSEDRAANGLSQRVAEIVEDHADLEGPMLPILHAIQREYGHVPPDALPALARELNMTGAEVHGVVSFYHDFRDHEAGRHVVKICRAEACQASGGDAVAEAALSRLGIGWHETTANGALTVEPVYCLGLCACGPSALVDGQPVGRLDAARIETILSEAGA